MVIDATQVPPWQIIPVPQSASAQQACAQTHWLPLFIWPAGQVKSHWPLAVQLGVAPAGTEHGVHVGSA